VIRTIEVLIKKLKGNYRLVFVDNPPDPYGVGLEEPGRTQFWVIPGYSAGHPARVFIRHWDYTSPDKGDVYTNWEPCAPENVPELIEFGDLLAEIFY